MIRKIISLLLVIVIVFAIPTFAEAEYSGSVCVVNVENLKASEVSGLSVSTAQIFEASCSLLWSKSDFDRNIELPAKKDWTGYKYFHFNMFSALKSQSAFGVIVMSDNPQTVGADGYELIVRTDFRGWQKVIHSFEEFVPFGQPLGFDSVDYVVLCHESRDYSLNTASDIFIENMYATNVEPQAQKEKDDFVLFDLSTVAGVNSSSVNSGVNVSMQKAPLKTTYSIRFTDDKASGQTGNAGWLNFSKLPLSDFTPYNTLQISMYNNHVSDDTIRVAIRSDDFDREGNEYYYGDISLDFEKQWQIISFRLDKLRVGGAPLGFDKINALQLWWYESENPASVSEVYIDKITLANVDYSKQWEEPVYLDEAPQTSDWFDFSARIKELYPDNEHPRLLATEADIEWIKANKTSDPYMKSVYPKFIELCNGYAVASIQAPEAMCATRAMNLALGYLLTGISEYKDACLKNINAITKEASTWAFDGQDLTVADVCREVAVTYDLMYNHLSDEQKTIMRNALVIYALEPMRNNLVKNGGATHETNWNPVINSGTGMAALAIADSEGYEESANQYLNRIYKVFGHCLKHYAPDGTGYEGPNYWNYMNGGYLPYENALFNSVGAEYYERFSALDEFGMNKTGDYIAQMHGTTNLSFNYGDGSAYASYNAGNFWLARYFNRPELAGGFYEMSYPGAYGMLMYRPNSEIRNWRNKMPLDYYGGGEVQVGSMRTSYEKGNLGFYVGYKGNGSNPSTHAKIDAGTFVLDALGTRFIEQLPAESYSKPGMFGSKRYEYYRNRAEGNNTLVVGPGVHQGSNTDEITDNQVGENVLLDQVKENYSPVVARESSASASYAVVDLTDAYRETAESVKRGFALVNGRNAFVLQDEITVKSPCEVYSFMHTQADVEISSDGKSAILTRYGKKLKATLFSDTDAKLCFLEASPLPTSPAVENSLNLPCKKLAVYANVASTAMISLIFVPYYGDGDYEYLPEKIPALNNWNSFLEAGVHIDNVYLDGVRISDFDSSKTLYTLNEDSVGEITADAGKGIKLKITQASNIGDVAVVEASYGGKNTDYTFIFSDEVQKKLDNRKSYGVKGYLASAGLVDVKNMTDGDFATGWENEGSQWVVYDLGSEKEVHEVQLYWKNQNKRTEEFDIQVSSDGERWTIVWSGESILSDKLERYSFDKISARYVKVTGYKNTQNNWTSISEFYITFDGTSFDDTNGHWAQKAIEDMAKVGILDGVSSRCYDPDSSLTRAQFIAMLNRLFNVEPGAYSGRIPDVSEIAWYTPFVEAAYASELIPEYILAGGFRPDADITREEISALVISYYEKYVSATQTVELDMFADRESISGWAKEYVGKSVATRLMNGKSADTFAPGENATRAEAAAVIKRIYIKIS